MLRVAQSLRLGAACHARCPSSFGLTSAEVRAPAYRAILPLNFYGCVTLYSESMCVCSPGWPCCAWIVCLACSVACCGFVPAYGLADVRECLRAISCQLCPVSSLLLHFEAWCFHNFPYYTAQKHQSSAQQQPGRALHADAQPAEQLSPPITTPKLRKVRATPDSLL